MNSTRRHNHHYRVRSRRHRKKYRPGAVKIIRTRQIFYDIAKVIVAAVFIFGFVSTARCKYFQTRSEVLQASIDSFYKEPVSGEKDLNKLQAKMNQVADTYKTTMNNWQVLQTENDELTMKIVGLATDMIILDTENVDLVKSNNEYYDELVSLREREELYDKYEYALNYHGSRTDITFEQLKTGVDIMESNNIDPDLLFAIIMTESHGTEKAKNAASTATGYGQVLYGTGRSVYERYMGNGTGTFENAMLLDGMTNIQITANYLDLLVKDSSSIHEALVKYRGSPDDGVWMSSVDSYCRKGDTSLAQINNEIYQ